MEENKVEIQDADNLRKAIERYSIDGFDMGLEDDEVYIPVPVLEQLLDHFIPKWRKREDKYYKYKKFATEQQMDRNITKLRDFVEEKVKVINLHMTNMKEFMDEFEAQAAEVKRIIEMDKIVMERIRVRDKEEGRP